MRIAIGLLIILLIVAGTHLYFTRFDHTPIGDIRQDPRKYEGKSLTIAGEVTDRTSLVFVKFFRVRDKTGEIVVVTSKTLPVVGSKARISGRVEEAFSIGPEQLLVFLEDENGDGRKTE